RCFATYNLLAGMPLNILQKVLGHSRVSTTALYIKDISGIIGIFGLGIVVFFTNTSSLPANSKDNKPTETPPVLPPSEEQDNCPYNEKSLASFSKHVYEQVSEKDLAQWKKIPQAEIPNLTTQERIGVLNGLIIMPNPRLNDPDTTAEEGLKIHETNF
ncbi:18366_t:CDS:2, partial [Funneliformis geosporum]